MTISRRLGHVAAAAFVAVSAISVQAGSAAGPSAAASRPQSAADAIKVAYVYNTNTGLRDNFKSFLELHGFSVALVPLASAASFSYNTVDVILIGDDTGGDPSDPPYTWQGSRSAAAVLANSTKPIITLGYGNQFFDAHGGLNIGWSVSAQGPMAGAIAVNPADELWTTPFPVPLAADNSINLYSYAGVASAVYSPTLGVLRIGLEAANSLYYPIASQNWTGQFGPVCRTQWGYRRGPEAFSGAGKRVFINLLNDNPCARGAHPRTDLSLSKTASAQSVTVGQIYTYTLVATNNGPADAPNVVVTDPLPATVVINGVTTTQGSCAVAANIVTCNLGTLLNGASATIRIGVKATETGEVINTARVRGDVTEAKPGDESDLTNTPVTNPPTYTALPFFPYRPVLVAAPVLFTGDLSIFGIEITQGMQCFDTSTGLGGCADNSLPVVAKKDSTARIYLRYQPTLGATTKSNVPVRLHIFANGVEYIANAQGKATNAINRGVHDAAEIWFNVDFSNDVNVSFYAVVDPGNVIAETNESNNRYPASGTIALNFRRHKTFKIVGQRLRYHPSGYAGTQNAGGWAVNGGAADWLEQVLPIRNNGINYVIASGYKDWTTSLGSGDGQHALIQSINLQWIMQNAFGWLFGTGAYTGARHVYGWAPNQGYSGGHADMPVYPHAGGLGVAGIGTDRVSDGNNTTDDPGGGALIFGHELVHDYNVLHTDVAGDCGSTDSDSDFPYSSASIQEFGFNPVTGKIYDPALTHDLMSYCPAGGSKEGWIAPFTWNKMAGQLDAAALSAASAEQAMAGGPVLVAGVRVTNPDLGPQTAGFDSAHKLDADMPLVVPAPGDYALQLRSVTGTILSSTSFTVSFKSEYSAHNGGNHEGPGTPDPTVDATVQFVVPWVDGTASLAVVKGASTLITRSVSASNPMVQITAPSTAVTWTAGTTGTLAWTGTDADGDALTYSVLYSHDGLQWDLLATGLTTTVYGVPVDALKGGNSAAFRVVANDGVLTGDDETDFPINVPDKAPVALITSPASSGALENGTLLVLQGTGVDFEDGTLPDVSMSWSGDRVGALGTGPSMPVPGLLPGWHVFTLTVTDSTGKSSSSTASVYVGAMSYLPLVER
jgi:uncharacterized repeat protein (TIGR01451 family)